MCFYFLGFLRLLSDPPISISPLNQPTFNKKRRGKRRRRRRKRRRRRYRKRRRRWSLGVRRSLVVLGQAATLQWKSRTG